MNRISAFELHIHPGDALAPARVSVAVQRYVIDPSGRVLITPECSSLDELEGQINTLQDELDELRERARQRSPKLLARWREGGRRQQGPHLKMVRQTGLQGDIRAKDAARSN